MATDSELLAEIPLFALLDLDERSELAKRLDRVRVPAGEHVFLHGDPGDALYVVRRGKVETSFRNDEGETIVLEVAGPGEFFGEISLLDGGPRTGTAMVVEDLDAIVVDREDLEDFLRVRPEAAIDLLSSLGRRLREAANLLRHAASRNVNVETEDNRTRVERIADWISAFSGTLDFLFIHLALFFVWIVLNVRPLVHTAFGGFDPFPFGLLTMAVSLEAIVLSVFVLLSQNRQVARDRVRNDVEYKVNLKAELEIAHLHEKVDALQAELLARLERVERGRSEASARVVRERSDVSG